MEENSGMKAPVLVYEPGVDGHHLTLLRCILEDLLAAGIPVTAALNPELRHQERIRAKLGAILEQVTLRQALPVKRGAAKHLQKAEELFREAGARHVFFPNLDEFSSSLFRLATWGYHPPAVLKGKMSGIYVRPRPLLGYGNSPKEWLKIPGFRRLVKQGWFHRIFLQDEQLTEQARVQGYDFFDYVPEPLPSNPSSALNEARENFGLPPARIILLHYGVASRRKGLHLTLQALQKMETGRRPFLLCAGPQLKDEEQQRALAELVAVGDALILDRFIDDREEADLLGASDVILLTYLGHFGVSAIQVRAAAAGRMIIASDEEMVGRHTREHKLGWLFPSGDAEALQQLFLRLPAQGPLDQSPWVEAGRRYAEIYSRERFRNALLPVLLTDS